MKQNRFHFVVPILILALALVAFGCNRAQILRDKAERNTRVGEYHKALSNYNELIAIEGETPNTYVAMGDVEMRLGNFAMACRHYDQGREMAPSQVVIYEKLATCYSKLGTSLKVRATWLSLLEIDPEHPRAHSELGSMAFDDGEFAQAERHYRVYLKAHPQDTVVLSALGAALVEQKKYQAAIDELAKAVNIDPHCALCHFNLGVAYLGANEMEEAEAEFIVVTRIEPSYHDGWVHLAATYNREGRTLKAIETLGKAKAYGFNDWPRIDGDPDFTSITDDVRYLNLKGDDIHEPDNDTPSDAPKPFTLPEPSEDGSTLEPLPAISPQVTPN